MDNRLFKFASIYELTSLAAGSPIIPAETAVRPGIGTRVMQGLSGAAGRLGEMTSSVGKGIKSITEIPANVRALTEPKANTEEVFDPNTQEFGSKITNQTPRVQYDSKTGKITGADTPEEIATLKTEGFSDRQIQQARNLAMRNHYMNVRNAKSLKRQSEKQRTIDQGRAMFTKGLSGSHLQAKLSTMSPLGKNGMLVMTGLSVLYYLFTGKKPTATTEDGTAVLMDVPPANSPVIQNIIPEIDAVINLSEKLSKNDIATSLGNVKKNLSSVQNNSLTIDDVASGQAFSQNIKNAEGSIKTALLQLESLSPILTDPEDLQKVQDLQTSFGNFIIDILDVRGMQV